MKKRSKKLFPFGAFHSPACHAGHGICAVAVSVFLALGGCAAKTAMQQSAPVSIAYDIPDGSPLSDVCPAPEITVTDSRHPPAGITLAKLIGSRQMPQYPISLEDTGPKGMVFWMCTIKVDGNPCGCKITKLSGNAAFADSVLIWLASDEPTYRPFMKGGVPIVGAIQTAIKFDVAGAHR